MFSIGGKRKPDPMWSDRKSALQSSTGQTLKWGSNSACPLRARCSGKKGHLVAAPNPCHPLSLERGGGRQEIPSHHSQWGIESAPSCLCVCQSHIDREGSERASAVVSRRSLRFFGGRGKASQPPPGVRAPRDRASAKRGRALRRCFVACGRACGEGEAAMSAGGEVERLAADLSGAGAGDEEEEWLYGGTNLPPPVRVSFWRPPRTPLLLRPAASSRPFRPCQAVNSTRPGFKARSSLCPSSQASFRACCCCCQAQLPLTGNPGGVS